MAQPVEEGVAGTPWSCSLAVDLFLAPERLWLKSLRAWGRSQPERSYSAWLRFDRVIGGKLRRGELALRGTLAQAKGFSSALRS